MAAERLTKQRLVHILIMMGVLIVAFVWRTFEHYQEVVVCKPQRECRVDLGNHHLRFVWHGDNEDYSAVIPTVRALKVELTNGEAMVVLSDDHLRIEMQSDVIEISIIDQEHDKRIKARLFK